MDKEGGRGLPTGGDNCPALRTMSGCSFCPTLAEGSLLLIQIYVLLTGWWGGWGCGSGRASSILEALGLISTKNKKLVGSIYAQKGNFKNH
jgi:hypothetical protein